LYQYAATNAFDEHLKHSQRSLQAQLNSAMLAGETTPPSEDSINS
jgi:hypothetical protein